METTLDNTASSLDPNPSREITTSAHHHHTLDFALGTDQDGERVAAVMLHEDGLTVRILKRHADAGIAGEHLARSVGEAVTLLRAANYEPTRRAISDLYDLVKLRETMHLLPGNRKPESETLQSDTGTDPNGPRDPYADAEDPAPQDKVPTVKNKRGSREAKAVRESGPTGPAQP